jgi:hypothetical protein
MPEIQALRRLRQKNIESEASLNCIVRPGQPGLCTETPTSKKIRLEVRLKWWSLQTSVPQRKKKKEKEMN